MATLRDQDSDPSVVPTEQETLDFAGRQLDRNRQDLPFTLNYLFDDDGAAAQVVGRTGIATGQPAAPAVTASGDPDPVWPAATLLRLAGRDLPVILAGDFDATPDSSSIRFWSGRQSLDGTSVAYQDAWEAVHPGEAGHTFTPRNPLVRAGKCS
jgi:hypothetical protein